MAQRACARNIADLHDVGDMSYDLVKPILRKIVHPQQLREIEISSPHIADFDAELWQAFIARDILMWEDKIVEPKNPRSWWKVYRKLWKDQQKAQEEQEQKLRATIMGIDKKKAENKTHVVQEVLPERAGRTFFLDGNLQRGTGGSANIKKPALKNAVRGRDILDAIRKESASARQEKDLGKLKFGKTVPPPPKAQITKAPDEMVRSRLQPVSVTASEHALEAGGTRRSPKLFGCQRSPHQKKVDEAFEKRNIREARLKAISEDKNSSAALSASSQPSLSTSSNPPKSMSPPEPFPSTNAASASKLSFGPSPVATSVARKRPTTSIFMPAKKRKL